jgi:ADP-ribose pyrophosphatase YjhB (NUDIX family)
MSAALTPAFHLETPAGEERERRVCDHCAWVDYRNPRIVVGSVVTWTPPEPGAEPRFLMCRRAIEPRRGFWTLPAGFMETGETVRDAARREAREEAECEIAIDAVLAMYDVVHVQQVQLMFRAALAEPVFSAGPESLEVRLFRWDEIPWDEIAFPSVRWALGHWREARGLTAFPPFGNPPDAPDGGAEPR